VQSSRKSIHRLPNQFQGLELEWPATLQEHRTKTRNTGVCAGHLLSPLVETQYGIIEKSTLKPGCSSELSKPADVEATSYFFSAKE
jgi:hypothetical protein